MAKKKINIKSVSTDVESGDVNISYKNVRIAGLSESTTAVLETKDTICDDDIEVEYTKQSGGDNTMYVHFTESEGVISCDYTPEEIYAAYSEGKCVCGIYLAETGENIAYLGRMGADITEEQYEPRFFHAYISAGDIYLTDYYYQYDPRTGVGSWSKQTVHK